MTYSIWIYSSSVTCGDINIVRLLFKFGVFSQIRYNSTVLTQMIMVKMS